MLNVERKKTDKIDWVKPLETYITAQYAHERDCLHDHKDAIANLQQLREDVRNIQDKSETARELLHRYHAILTSVETRFPVHENNIRISFPWYDSYKGKKLASFSVHYEKMNVLFNIGALSHQIASSQNKTTADGLKIACQNHQQAAGAFTRLKEELEKHPQSNSFDLTMDSISMLIQLNLAQAQECFYEKAVKDNMNPSIVAKLSAQVVDFYDATATLLHTSALSSSVPRNWVTFVEYKLQLFRANSHYRQSLVHLTTDDYGAQIARLRIAHNCMEDIKKKQLRSLTPELQNDVNTMSNTVQKALQEAEKDNDTIYHSVVVPESKLPAIERKPIVKALPLPESAVMTSEKDPFVRLIPFAITEKLSVYVSRKEALIRSELQSLDEMNNMAIGSLSSMGLPGSIQAIESTGVPSALQEKMLSVKREGGHALVKEQLETLDKMSQEDDRLLKETSRILQQEEQDDNNMRQQYGTRWQRTPSHALTASLTQEASKWAANISHARKSDALLQKEFRDHEAAIIRLSLTQDELLRQLPSSSGPQGNDGGIVLQLKQNLSALDRLMTVDRPVLRTEISGLSAQDDISIRLMACEPGREEDLYNTELQKYDVIKEKIQNSQRDQERLLEEIYNLNMKFQESRNLGGAAQQRGQVLQSLDTAHKVRTYPRCSRTRLTSMIILFFSEFRAGVD